MDMQFEFNRMRMDLMHASPFYGSLLLNVPILEDGSVSTACTDGRCIRYNKTFMERLTQEERRFVLMHELFHILLMHPSRGAGKDHYLFNVAADLIVNEMCVMLSNFLGRSFLMKAPQGGVYARVNGMAMEELYARLMDDQLKAMKGLTPRRGHTIMLRSSYGKYDSKGLNEKYVPGPGEVQQDGRHSALGSADLQQRRLSDEERAQMQRDLRDWVRNALKGDPGMGSSLFVPREIIAMGEHRPLPWKRLLRDFMVEEEDDDTSYATPERKYIHMDLILPGHGLREGGVTELWAFVDSSGSIEDVEMKRFLSELYHLIHGFHCTLNIAYWDTSVTEVYRKVDTIAKLRDARPRHSGGTDINCVYRWIAENRVKPDVMVILTDGCFGALRDQFRPNRFRKKTILVLSQDIANRPGMREIGKVAVLGGK